jgi:hypothetical protein
MFLITKVSIIIKTQMKEFNRSFLKLTVQDFEEEAKKQIEENGVCKQGAHPKPIPVAPFKYSTI